MQQLSGMDASFLDAETSRAHMAGAGVIEGLDNVASVAMAPISARDVSERSTAGNVISEMLTTLGTDVDDPAERLAVMRDGTQSSKDLASALGARMRPVFNCTVSNMPGPRQMLPDPASYATSLRDSFDERAAAPKALVSA
ncbi:MAG: hypothetical protein QM733_20360 [Ilumatobacteraceae bacterium]